MKLPSGFGGKGFAGALAQAQQSLARAQTLDAELATQRVEADKGLVKAIFDGNGLILGLKIDKAVVDPEDVEALEDLVVSAVRDGYAKAMALRDEKVREITANIPGADKLLR